MAARSQCPCQATPGPSLVDDVGRGEQVEDLVEQREECPQVFLPGLARGLGRMVEATQERSSIGIDEDHLRSEVAVDEAGPVDLAERPTEGGTQ